ncbi:hypothetical protein B0H13DRAFT_235353 [Mycena leptocephala]|nr:hypothetical protein B0H13DRAFT_235353 [Mycena leptocephala]
MTMIDVDGDDDGNGPSGPRPLNFFFFFFSFFFPYRAGFRSLEHATRWAPIRSSFAFDSRNSSPTTIVPMSAQPCYLYSLFLFCFVLTCGMFWVWTAKMKMTRARNVKSRTSSLGPSSDCYHYFYFYFIASCDSRLGGCDSDLISNLDSDSNPRCGCARTFGLWVWVLGSRHRLREVFGCALFFQFYAQIPGFESRQCLDPRRRSPAAHAQPMTTSSSSVLQRHAIVTLLRLRRRLVFV